MANMIIRITIMIAALVVCATASAGPLLTKSQIAKAARDIEACLDKQDDDAKCVGIIQGPCDDAISAGGEAALIARPAPQARNAQYRILLGFGPGPIVASGIDCDARGGTCASS